MSLDGRHGAAAEATAWALVDADAADLVASDAHSETRPPELDWAYELVADRYGARGCPLALRRERARTARVRRSRRLSGRRGVPPRVT